MVNWSLLNHDYENRRHLRKLLRSLDQLYEKACEGDSVAHDIYLDLTEAIENAPLSIRQRRYLIFWIEKETHFEIASRYSVSRQMVTKDISKSLKKIMEILVA